MVITLLSLFFYYYFIFFPDFVSILLSRKDCHLPSLFSCLIECLGVGYVKRKIRWGSFISLRVSKVFSCTFWGIDATKSLGVIFHNDLVWSWGISLAYATSMCSGSALQVRSFGSNNVLQFFSLYGRCTCDQWTYSILIHSKLHNH